MNMSSMILDWIGNITVTSLLFAGAVVIYWFITFVVKFLAYELVVRKDISKNRIQRGCLYMLVSPDFYLSHFFKEHAKIKGEQTKGKLIQRFNSWNLLISIFTFLALIIASTQFNVHFFLLFLILIRCFSRSVEIGYAFLMDVIYKKSRKSWLNAQRRIRLALSSYVELYFLYASVYFVSPITSHHGWDSVVLGAQSLLKSFGVGTLTNVSGAYEGANIALSYVIYGQVFTTLILVVMSLAIYVGRAK
ncbi:hypothetical protein CGK33_23750 [Vibrio parahaemolyticus]|nr:hypothetical protein CGK33_23750 [Vibrio parahaemolyticus]